MLAISTQGSHISERYYKSRIPQIPVEETTSNSTPTYRCTKANLPQMPGPIRTANGGNATAAVTAATHAPLIPGAMRIAVRDAGSDWVSTGPVTKRWYTPVRPYHHDDGPPPASSSWHESDSIMIMMQEDHPAHRSEQHPSEADYTRAAAVRCCRAGFPCASRASSSCWGWPPLAVRLYVYFVICKI